MIPVQDMTADELRQAAFEAILTELGPTGLARFVQENNLAAGDYTADRNQWLAPGLTVERLLAEWDELQRGSG